MNETTSGPEATDLLGNLKEWNFPFQTCERMLREGWALQPYSAAVNMATTLTMLWFVFGKQGIALRTRLAIVALAQFEAFHAYSHMVHLEDKDVQMNTIHLLAYLFAGGVMACFAAKFGIGKRQMVIVGPVLATDILVFVLIGKFYQVATGFSVLISIVISYYPLVEPDQKSQWLVLAAGAAGIMSMILVEAACCQFWVTHLSSTFPYHVAIESFGLYLFWLLAHSLSVMDITMKKSTEHSLKSKKVR